MKKKILFGSIATILIFIMMFALLFFVVLRGEIEVDPSQNGDYEVVSWLIDKGGAGYSGAFYMKEKGLFSKWYKLGTEIFAGEWISETLFAVRHSYIVDDWYKEYNANDYFGK